MTFVPRAATARPWLIQLSSLLLLLLLPLLTAWGARPADAQTNGKVVVLVPTAQWNDARAQLLQQEGWLIDSLHATPQYTTVVLDAGRATRQRDTDSSVDYREQANQLLGTVFGQDGFSADYDAEVHTTAPYTTEADCCWNLDRIDQRSLPLDGVFTRPATDGAGVDIYVIDTGVQQTNQLTVRNSDLIAYV